MFMHRGDAPRYKLMVAELVLLTR